jgi:hypothetical protein
MRFYTIQHQFYCGIDLPVDWRYVGVLKAAGEGCRHKPIRTNSKAVLQVVPPFRADVVVGVECLFTWDLAR